MNLIDLDRVDWSKCPREVLDMVSIDDVRLFLRQQPVFIGVPLTDSSNPKIRMAAATAAMNLNQAIASIYPLMMEYIKEKKGENQK